MLYNVLPPLVFFASLGGTIFIVSRVVTRLHRQNLATASARVINTRDLAALLGPSQKSVHVIKNRLTVVSRLFQQFFFQTKEKIAALRNLPAIKIKPPVKYLAKIRQTLDKAKARVKQVKIRKTTIPNRQLKVDNKPILRIIVEEPAVTTRKTSSSPAVKIPKTAPVATSNLAKKIFSKKPKATSLDTARQQLSACRYQSAEKTLVPFLAKHPRNTRAYMLLGKAALGRHNWGEASEVFEQVVSLKPNTKGCYAALGYANYKAGKLTKAMEALKKAHDADPNNVVIIKRLLSIARRMDNLPLQHSLTAQLAELKTSARQ